MPLESLNSQPGNHTLIDGAWDADGPKAALVHRLRALQDDDAPFVLKHPHNRAPGKPGHSGNLIDCVCLFCHAFSLLAWFCEFAAFGIAKWSRMRSKQRSRWFDILARPFVL